jgi:hypothetical protein
MFPLPVNNWVLIHLWILLKRIEAFPATECEKPLAQLRRFGGDFQHQISDSMIIDLSVIETRIIWPDAAHLKKHTGILREVQSDTGRGQTAA